MTLDALLVSDQLAARDRALVALAVAGVGREAIAELRRRDLVVWEASGTVLVRLRHRRQGPAQASSTPRFALLEGAAASAVSRYLDELGHGGDPAVRIFRSQTGRPLSPTGVYYVLRRALGERAA